jgi:hypothetical protein
VCRLLTQRMELLFVCLVLKCVKTGKTFPSVARWVVKGETKDSYPSIKTGKLKLVVKFQSMGP